MKKRYGFVSNSSSSSFIIRKKFLTEEQINLIKNHSTCGEPYAKEYPWDIIEEDDHLEAFTSMDNFDLWAYLYKIGVNNAKERF
jgi:hypothetical protein